VHLHEGRKGESLSFPFTVPLLERIRGWRSQALTNVGIEETEREARYPRDARRRRGKFRVAVRRYALRISSPLGESGR